MRLPRAVNELIEVLRQLPQAWLADRALMAAREVDLEPVEPVLEREDLRAIEMLTWIAKQLDSDLKLIGVLPTAMEQALERLDRGPEQRVGRPAIRWILEDGTEAPQPIPNIVAIATFRDKLGGYIREIIDSVRDSSPGFGSGSDNPPAGFPPADGNTPNKPNTGPGRRGPR